jgi:CRISPR system Cascade subunit CasB
MRMSDETLRAIIVEMQKRVEEADNGPRAQLRRATPDKPWSATLWTLLAAEVPDEAWALDEATRAEEERAWAALLSAMAGSSQLGIPAQEPLGETLAGANYSELRLNRLLRAHGQGLLDEVRLMAAYLESRGCAVRWSDVGSLLLRDAEMPSGEIVRRRIARSYYSALHKAQ